MARFVDLDEDDAETPHQGVKPVWDGLLPIRPIALVSSARADRDHVARADAEGAKARHDGEAHEFAVTKVPNPNRNSMTEALGCYP